MGVDTFPRTLYSWVGVGTPDLVSLTEPTSVLDLPTPPPPPVSIPIASAMADSGRISIEVLYSIHGECDRVFMPCFSAMFTLHVGGKPVNVVAERRRELTLFTCSFTVERRTPGHDVLPADGVNGRPETRFRVASRGAASRSTSGIGCVDSCRCSENSRWWR